MKKATLTPEDIEKISLYIPFKVMFEPVGAKSILDSQLGAGILGSIVVHAYNAEDMEITSTTNIGHAENTDLPILRLLETMTDEELSVFETLTGLHQVTKEEMADEILSGAKPATFLYALSRHFDLFNLIPDNKAIQKEKSYRYQSEK